MSIKIRKSKILVVQLGRIGDLILRTAMFRALKQSNHSHEIHLLAGRNNHLLGQYHPLIDKTYVHSKKIFPTLKLIYQLRKEHYDIWIDPKDHFSSESKIFARLSNAEMRIGYNKNNRGVFTHPVEPGEKHKYDHLALQGIKTLQYLQVDTSNIQPMLYVEEKSEIKLTNFLNTHHIKNYYCVNVSANGPDRKWIKENWIELLNTIHKSNHGFIVISAPGDEEYANQIVQATKDSYYYSTATIIDVFSVINHSGFVITPDTSVVHIAAAFDKPIIALYVNLKEFYSKFFPLSNHFRAVMESKRGATVSDISTELVLENYYSLRQEIQKTT